jgi:membrane-associated phospholipid phosphatase
VAFRYSSLGNALYGPAIAGDQSYKDKSIDVKALLWDETAFLPALAVGFRDITGTGLFSGEYLVASKRTGAFDWSLGLGWGYLGARGNLSNPLGSGDRPQAEVGQGGNFSFGTYFQGRTSLFGGVQWQTPWSPLVLKLEYDGNDYQREPFGARFEQRSPFNVGAVYRVGPNLDLTLGYERGDRIMLGFSINTQLDGLRMPKTADAPRVPVARGRPQVPMPVAQATTAQAPMATPSTAQSVDPSAAQSVGPSTAQSVVPSTAQSADTSAARAPIDWQPSREALRVQTQWHAARFDLRGRELRVTFDDAEAGYWHDRVDRAASVLHRDAPADVDRFVLAYRQRGAVMAEHVVDRDAWVRERFELLPPREQRPSVMARPPAVAASAPQSAPQPSASAPADVAPPRFEHGLSLALRTSFGGPDAFLLYQLSAVERFRWRLRADTWMQGTVALGLIDNYDRFRYTAPSNLPRVRTYAREYVTSTSLTLPNLQVTHVGNPARDHFYSVYGGYLESMFAGVGGEWLYRPFGSRVALGVDANLVRQRSYEQDFSFGNAGTQTGYQVATGHATLYWDTGWNDVRAMVAAGRYLAGDIGATFQLSRGFDNGVTVGAFFTKTNVSAERFGEGSFDKGIFVRVPFDAFLMRSSARAGTFLYQPLTRDGGARLGRAVQLIQHTALRDEQVLRIRAPSTQDPVTGFATEGRVEASRDPAEQADRWLRRQGEDEARTRVVPRAFVAADRTTAPTAPASRSLPSASPDSFEALDAQLYAQGFRDLHIEMDASRTLSVSVTRDRIESPSRAVGRVARTATAHAPLDTRGLRVTLARRGAPMVTYDFFDFAQLQAVMDAREGPQALQGRVGIDWHDAGAREADALSGLVVLDRPTQPEPGPTLTQVLLPEAGQVARVRDDFMLAGSAVRNIDWLRAGTVFGATVLGASLLDERVDRAAYRHREADWMRAGIRVGDALPWAALAGSALLAFDPSDADRARTARSAAEAGASGMVLAWALKPLAGRARPGPTSGASHRDFEPFSFGGGRDSFPSTHATVAWAVLTPWALEYNAPWLYGVAGLTNLARAGGREHWLSDTVAGSVLGYGLGYLFWQSGRTPARPGEARVSVGPQQVTVGWNW